MNPLGAIETESLQFAPEILHLGCGRRKYPDAFGIDIASESDADLIWDLDCLPWPLPDHQFREVYLIDVLEHLANTVAAMEEIYRVSKNGAQVAVHAPFASSHHLWTDPTHRRGFTSRSFKYFSEDFALQHFKYTHARFQVLEVSYRCHAAKWYDRVLLLLANRRKLLYEKRFMYWYPVESIFFRLQVLK